MSLFLNILQYFFDPLPSGPFKYMFVLIATAVLALALSIGLRIYIKKQKDDKIFRKLFRDFPGKMQIFAFSEAIYILVRYERMPYLSIRFLNYMVLAYGLYIVFRAAQLYLKVYPADKKHHTEQLKLNKYLPRKRNRKH